MHRIEGRLPKKPAPFDRCEPIRSILFVSESVNRVEPRSLYRGDEAEDNADDHGEQQGDDARRYADGNGSPHDPAHHKGKADSKAHAKNSAQCCQNGSLRQELPQNTPLPCAYGKLQSDLLDPFRYTDKHDVHDADAAYEKRDSGDPQQLIVCSFGKALQVAGFFQQILRLVDY